MYKIKLTLTGKEIEMMIEIVVASLVVLLAVALYRYTYVLEWVVAPNSSKRNEISSRGFWWDDHYCFSCDNFVKNCTCEEEENTDMCDDEYEEEDWYDDDDDE